MEPRVTAVIQGRMTSTRLPGKVLLEVMGRPLLSYQIERLRYSRKIDDIVMATTTNKEDDPIVAFAQKEQLKVYRGSEDDVLDRYYQTAKKYNIEHVIRITADCPLIDPNVCDLVIGKYLNSGADYVHTGQNFAEGLDCGVISARVLYEAWQNAKLDSEREHVTLYLRNHSDRFNIIALGNETDDSRFRITVDEPEDFMAVKTILSNLYMQLENPFTIEDIKLFLNSNPDVFKLNAGIKRNEGLLKSLLKDSLK